MPDTNYDGMSKELRDGRSRLGVAARRAMKTGDLADIAERDRADAEYRTLSIAEYVERVVNKAPALTAEQRERIAASLRVTT